MVVVDYLMGIPSPKLNVPDRFEVINYFSCPLCIPWSLNELTSDKYHKKQCSAHFTLSYNLCIDRRHYIYVRCLCLFTAANIKAPGVADWPPGNKSLVDITNGSTSCTALHHPHIYGPADHCCHHQPQGAQAQGQTLSICVMGRPRNVMSRIIPCCNIQRGTRCI